MDWSHSVSIKLIELYKEKECLWNPTHDDYKSKTKRTDAWINISEILNHDINDVKKKMESLLTSFRRERVKEKTSNKSDARVYKSRWFAFNKMQFLMEKFTQKHTRNTEELSRNKETVQLTENDNNAESDSNVADNNSTRSNEGVPEKGLSLPRLSVNHTGDPTPHKRTEVILKRRKDGVYKILKVQEKHQSHENSLVYGEYIASKHKKYSARTKNVVEHLISGILFNADMGRYDIPTSTNPLVCHEQQSDLSKYPHTHEDQSPSTSHTVPCLFVQQTFDENSDYSSSASQPSKIN